MKKDLEKFIGKKVYELPEEMITEIRKNFAGYDGIEDLEITTWERFILSVSVTDGTEDGKYWFNTMKDNPHLWISDEVCIVKINIGEMPDVRQIMANYDDDLAIVDWGEPVLIIDADDPEFGYGYIGVEVTPSADEWEEGTAQLVLDFATIDEAVSRPIKKKDLNDPENYKQLVSLAEEKLLHNKDKQYATDLEDIYIFLKAIKSWELAGVEYDYDNNNLIFHPPVDEDCLLLVEKAKKDRFYYDTLQILIGIMHIGKIPLPQCFNDFAISVFLGITEPPKIPSRIPDTAKKAKLINLINYFAIKGYSPVTRSIEYEGKKSILDAIIEANEKVKAYDFLTYDSLKNYFYRGKKEFSKVSDLNVKILNKKKNL
jgi:hypothetical protein